MSPNSTTERTTNPNEHLPIPNWINEDYFQDILEKDIPNFVRIVNFKPIAATAPGENYTSIMVRVVIDVELKDGTTESTSYILKTCFETGDGAALIKSMNMFPREKEMYQNYLPSFEKLYKEAGLNIKLSPKCLRVEETPERTTLVMEDLKIHNFTNIDRMKGMDMKHATQVLRRIAELHAVSATYKEINGPYDDKYMQSFFNDVNRPIFENMFKIRENVYFRAMRTWGLENPDLYINNTPSPEVLLDEAMSLNSVDPDEFNVLNHGDCWSNNIMFRHKENGEIDDTLFVDFQIGKWGTPAQDLWYFIVTSLSLDIKVKEFDHFIHIYHKRLVECLQALKYPKHIPSLKELHILMLKYGYWAIITMNIVLSAVLLPSDKDANVENMLKVGPEADALRYRIFTNPIFAAACRQLYQFFDNKGLWGIEFKA